MFATATLIVACLLGIASLFPLGIFAWYVYVQRSLRSGPRVLDATKDTGRLFVFSARQTSVPACSEAEAEENLPENPAAVAREGWSRPEYIAPEEYQSRGYAFTIRSGRTSLPRVVSDRGGFAVVPFLVYDAREMSFFVRTKIYLN